MGSTNAGRVVVTPSVVGVEDGAVDVGAGVVSAVDVKIKSPVTVETGGVSVVIRGVGVVMGRVVKGVVVVMM